MRDGIVAGIIRESMVAKSTLAKQLIDKPTETFEQYYAVGDNTANSLAGLVLDKQPWSSEITREASELDVFMLFLAKLLQVGNDYDGRALKGISRLMASDANNLAKLIDSDIFDAILSSLDIRLPIEVRSQATLTVAKFLEVCAEEGQQYLTHYIQLRVQRQTCMALTRAFSAAAAIFPIVPSMGASMFLIDGFVPSLVPLVSKKSENDVLEQAALEMLSAACIDSGCRQAIGKHFSGWLHQILDSDTDHHKGLAAVILAKIQGLISNPVNGQTREAAYNVGNATDDLISRLQRMMLSSSQDKITSAIEGLAYVSSRSEVKETLSKDTEFLAGLFAVMKSSSKSTTNTFGALTILSNMASYPPTHTEEQKKMSQLKAYASASKPSDPHPNDLPPAVTARCRALLSADVVSAIVNLPRSSLSSTSLSLAFSIFLSLAQTQTHRGVIAQQGGAKFLLQSYALITGTSIQDHSARHTAAWALSRILISVNPILIFPASGSPPLTSSIRPLVSLLSTPNTASSNPFSSNNNSEEQPRSLLPTFESLLALTNLASCPPSTGIQSTIVKSANMPSTIEDFFLSENQHIQRASVELACNLCVSPEGLALFTPTMTTLLDANEGIADPSTDSAAKRRLHILLALADSPHVATRRAAGGALASITSTPAGVSAVLARDRGGVLLLGLCGPEEKDEGCVHRGLVCVGNVIGIGEEEGRRKIREIGGVDVLRDVEQGWKGEVGELAKEVGRMLKGEGEGEGRRVDEVVV